MPAKKETAPLPPEVAWGSTEGEKGCCGKKKQKQEDERNALQRTKKTAFETKERKVRGFRMPEFLGLLATLVLPVSEAATDWSVVLKWYLDGDEGWFLTGLTINLVSGAISGLALGAFFTQDSETGEKKGMQEWKALPLGLLFGVTGLAPVAYAALTLVLGQAVSVPIWTRLVF